ncbi:hypothetical protein FNF27_07500 [Cafeteria roenbergensis]|uniref:D-aminoacyl-tRNA deacylase n=1 Tax=Cafeteria roenbergensis TaxID=33653 RepID=A0A5A8DJ97_CAFRO|nr:hypothetical protein FNF29_05499 [Cafeteria roenbergensis]KAA0165278.1 hypothetical protein FNF31_01931 [Cafeteria roenbergensis]KAA0165411.1 hypothetical protein FNF28_03467 [Cafeteria roenbergensis]KAA0166428.1 hypothetical protein FNF27_07500 [Cafeteria roenbergensis]|eukprot:KAA0150058.1 hypothetical protein FNF29_05499 [Cafeteria roenbergensis]
MRALLQRVTSASVTIDGKVVGRIGPGLLALVGVCEDDAKADSDWIISRMLGVRLWPEPAPADGGEPREWRTNVVDLVDPTTGAPGEVLVVSQFTLYGGLKKGNKPDFHRAMAPADARAIFDGVLDGVRAGMRKKGGAGAAAGAGAGAAATAEADGAPVDRVATGEFGAMMQVALVNDGPVTLMLDSRNKGNADPSGSA